MPASPLFPPEPESGSTAASSTDPPAPCVPDEPPAACPPEPVTPPVVPWWPPFSEPDAPPFSAPDEPPVAAPDAPAFDEPPLDVDAPPVPVTPPSVAPCSFVVLEHAIMKEGDATRSQASREVIRAVRSMFRAPSQMRENSGRSHFRRAEVCQSRASASCRRFSDHRRLAAFDASR
jgi:hypothetical protein